MAPGTPAVAGSAPGNALPETTGRRFVFCWGAISDSEFGAVLFSVWELFPTRNLYTASDEARGAWEGDLAAPDSEHAWCVRRMAHGSELADLFFRADKVLSEADQARTNELRRNYRQWRKGDEGVEPHADPVALKHTATIDETRSRAKMRRVKTYGTSLGAMGDPARASSLNSAFEGGRDRAPQVSIRRLAKPASVPLPTTCRRVCIPGEGGLSPRARCAPSPRAGAWSWAIRVGAGQHV